MEKIIFTFPPAIQYFFLYKMEKSVFNHFMRFFISQILMFVFLIAGIVRVEVYFSPSDKMAISSHYSVDLDEQEASQYYFPKVKQVFTKRRVQLTNYYSKLIEKIVLPVEDLDMIYLHYKLLQPQYIYESIERPPTV